MKWVARNISGLRNTGRTSGVEPLTQRLTHYCVYGKSAAEIANMLGVGDRELVLVLKQDLRDCAVYFCFLSVPGGDKRSEDS